MNVPNGAVDLGQVKQLQQQRQAAINADILATAQQIYVRVVSGHIATGRAITTEQCRMWAQDAARAAPYPWVVAGIVKLAEDQCQ